MPARRINDGDKVIVIMSRNDIFEYQRYKHMSTSFEAILISSPANDVDQWHFYIEGWGVICINPSSSEFIGVEKKVS